MLKLLNRSVLECLSFLVWIDARLIKQRSERFRIDQIPLSREVLAEDAATFFSEAVF